MKPTILTLFLVALAAGCSSEPPPYCAAHDGRITALENRLAAAEQGFIPRVELEALAFEVEIVNTNLHLLRRMVDIHQEVDELTTEVLTDIRLRAHTNAIILEALRARMAVAAVTNRPTTARR